jgi:hypothetical protein
MKSIIPFLFTLLLFTSCSKEKDSVVAEPENQLAFTVWRSKFVKPEFPADTNYVVLNFVSETEVYNVDAYPNFWGVKRVDKGTYTIDKNTAKLQFLEWSAQAEIIGESLVFHHPDGDRMYYLTKDE